MGGGVVVGRTTITWQPFSSYNQMAIIGIALGLAIIGWSTL